MYSILTTLSLLVLAAHPIHSVPSNLHERTTPLPLPYSIVHQFPIPTWVENLAVRSNSQNGILCTLLTTPDLYYVDPATGAATLLHSFSSLLALTGIAQLGHDIFYVAGGNFSVATQENPPGTYSVWKVDMRLFDEERVAGVTVSKLVDIKEALLLNGVGRLDAASETLLVADSFLGAVWAVDVETGAYEVGVQVPEMAPPPGGPGGIGVNGVTVKDGFLYFSNTGQETMVRVPIDVGTGKAVGKAEVLASGIQPDDFAFGEGGLIWMAQNVRNTISVLDKTGKVTNVLGSQNELTIGGPSSCRFGKEDKLYCSTTGGLASQVNGTFTGGRIMGIETEGFQL